MNSYTVKILIFLLSLFVLITISSQIYLALKGVYKTEIAVYYSALEKISFNGVYIRNETVITDSGAGVVSYTNIDSSKIAKNSVVAVVHNNEREIANNQRIKALEKELAMLRKVQNPGTTQIAQPEFLTKLIDEKYQSVAYCTEKKDLAKLYSERDELLTLMNIMQIVVKNETDYNIRINALEGEVASLKASAVTPLRTITTDKAGYFVSYTDGYESQLTFDSINEITAKQIINITETKMVQSKDDIGKIIDGYKWKMVGVIDNSRNNLIQGTQIPLNIASSPYPVMVNVEDIKDMGNSSESIVVLSCDKLTYNLVQNRVERVEMLLNNYEGIKVPRTAIRFLNDEKGVYVKYGNEIVFKKLKITFEAGDYVISEDLSTDGYLKVFDDIIVEGIKVPTNQQTTSVTNKPTSQSESSQEKTSQKTTS